MDESQDVGIEKGGITRRDVITKSVVAGGLVWASPVLFSGRAGAAAPCCDVGTPYTIKVAEVGGVNCGVACISSQADVNFPCPPKDFQDCLNNLQLIVGDFTEGGDDTATIHLAPGITVIAAAVKASDKCYFTECGNMTTSRTDNVHPNTCFKQSGAACGTGFTMPPNRIWVVPGAQPNSLDVKVNTHDAPDETLNHVELSICVAPEITGLCP